jgi:O-acetyl-ADP-ribose deacetylase (regulator of RNase III)
MKIDSNRIELLKGDITKLEVDAIVNAANTRLMGGGGVDGAIHNAAGSDLLKECITIGGCPPGEARITKGYQLPAKHVIHAVGPIWRGGYSNESEVLASAYINSLKLALENKLSLVAFPTISTGVYGYPKESAARIAFRSVNKFLQKHPFPKKVLFVCFDEENFEVYKQLMEVH